MDEKLYTTRELAEIVRVPEEAIRRWIRNKKIRSIKLPNGIYRIPESVVRELLEEDKTA